MDKYTTYDTINQVATATGRKHPADGNEVPKLDEGLVILLEVDGPDPEYDSTTHQLGGWGERVYDIEAGTATRTRLVVPKDPRQIKRDAMAEKFRSQPAWIRGAFYPQFMAANQLLDVMDDEGAITLVEDTDPNEKTKGTSGRTDIFEQVKAEFIADIQSLSE